MMKNKIIILLIVFSFCNAFLQPEAATSDKKEVKDLFTTYIDLKFKSQIQEYLGEKYPPPQFKVIVMDYYKMNNDFIKNIPETALWTAKVNFTYTLSESGGKKETYNNYKDIYLNATSRKIMEFPKISSSAVFFCAEKETKYCSGIEIELKKMIVKDRINHFKSVLLEHGITNEINCRDFATYCKVRTNVDIGNLLRMASYDWVYSIVPLHKTLMNTSSNVTTTIMNASPLENINETTVTITTNKGEKRGEIKLANTTTTLEKKELEASENNTLLLVIGIVFVIILFLIVFLLEKEINKRRKKRKGATK